MPFTYFACPRGGTETCLEASNTRRSSCGGLKRDFNKRVAKVLFIFKYGTIPSGRWKRKVEGGRRDGDAVEGENIESGAKRRGRGPSEFASSLIW